MSKFVIILFAVAVLLFAGLEVYLHFQERGRADARQDAESLKRIGLLRSVAFLLGILFTFFPLLPLPGVRNLHLPIAAVLVLLGFALRAWAIFTLGESFTSLVMTREGQRLVINGPYRYLRHPGYAGGLLFIAGLGAATGSLIGLVVMLLLMFYAFHRRIEVEERVMRSAFGEAYFDYMKETRRIVPFIY